MPDTARRYSVDEVLAFPDDGNRYELVDGELLVTSTPGPLHQLVLGRLYLELVSYLKEQPEHTVLFSPAEITWGDNQFVQPDLFAIPAAEVSTSWETVKTLLLAVEVLSPSSERGDRSLKRGLYQRQGVQTYWIVDADAALIEVWRPEDDRPVIATDTLRWCVTSGAEEFALDLGTLFADLPR